MLKSLAVAASTAAITVSTLLPATAEEATPPLVTDIGVILAMNPGLTETELERGLRKMAKSQGVSYATVLSKVSGEAERAMGKDSRKQLERMRTEATAPRMTASSGGGDGSVTLPSPKYVGDVFIHKSVTVFVNHGHTGMYTSTKKIAEAPGSGKVSRKIYRWNKSVPDGTRLYSVGKSQKRRNAAVQQINTYYLGKPYDKAFWKNKTNGSSKLNCSELVYRAYRWNSYSRISVDGNGGSGVYPYDIRDSGWTDFYRAL